MRILLSIFLGIMCLSVSLLEGQTQASITPEVLDTIRSISESDTLAAMAFVDKYADAPLDSLHLELDFLRAELIDDIDLQISGIRFNNSKIIISSSLHFSYELCGH